MTQQHALLAYCLKAATLTTPVFRAGRLRCQSVQTVWAVLAFRWEGIVTDENIQHSWQICFPCFHGEVLEHMWLSHGSIERNSIGRTPALLRVRLAFAVGVSPNPKLSWSSKSCESPGSEDC